MESVRIRIKTGEHELESDGPPEVVDSHIRAFLRILGREEKTEPEPPKPEPPAILKVAHIDGKVVSLVAECESLDQAVLALLLGHAQFRGAAVVAGAEIMAGLRASGHNVERADHVLKRHAQTGLVVVVGKRRLKRYRLTTDGIRKAQEIAQALASTGDVL
jgi:hypothetical protein